MDVKAAHTKKIGPLPAWAYGVVIGVAGLGYKMMKGGSSGNPSKGQVTNQQLIPTGAMPIEPSAGYLNELAMQQQRLEALMTDILAKGVVPGATVPAPQPAPNTPTTGRWTEAMTRQLIKLRTAFPSWYAAYKRIPGIGPTIQKPGETPAARTLRLQREYAVYIQRLYGGALPAISAKPPSTASWLPGPTTQPPPPPVQ
jgi:hypothetical protein